MRILTLHQKVILLNTFITAKVWYLSSVIPPQCVHTSKLTAAMGRFLFRGLPARIPMQQLARSKDQGGLKLQLPAIKCKALLANRHLQEIDSIPYYHSFLSQDLPSPANLPCLNLLSQQLPSLPLHIRQHPSSDQIHRFYLAQTEQPRVERNHAGINWRKVWNNISSKRLSSSQRSDLYLLVNEKTEHRKLLHTIGRADNPYCQHCLGTTIETLQHKFCECPRVTAAWEYIQRNLTATLGGWQRLTFGDLVRPTLDGVTTASRINVLTKFMKYINFVNSNINNRIDVDELVFVLSLE